jgi:hypothetical protein
MLLLFAVAVIYRYLPFFTAIYRFLSLPLFFVAVIFCYRYFLLPLFTVAFSMRCDALEAHSP